MNERFKELRLALNMNQEEFGKILGITKSGVSDIENGRRKVTEQHIKTLLGARELTSRINEDWLRNGNGDIFLKLTKKDELILWASTALSNESEDFRNRFVDALSKLDVDDWELLANMAVNLANRKNKD